MPIMDDKQRKKEAKQMVKGGGENKEIWVTHYSSNHQILLVGEGDFSFSLSLANCFGSASNIVASSLDSNDNVVKKYKKGQSNLKNLKMLGASILHGVDATKMKLHSDLKMRKFNRIIFNFPHVGFYGKEDNDRLIKMHTNLVEGFFRNANDMLSPYGEVHVNHKTTAPFCDWNIEELANRSFLVLADCVDFKKEDYPGYNNKRGNGIRCDEPFPLGACSTFKFRLPAATKMLKTTSYSSLMNQEPEQVFQDIPIQTWQQQLPASFNLKHPQTSTFMNTIHNFSVYNRSSAAFSGTESANIHDDYFNHAPDNQWRSVFNPKAQRYDMDGYMAKRRRTSQNHHESPASFNPTHHQTSFSMDINGFPGLGSFSIRRESANYVFDGPFSLASDTHQSHSDLPRLPHRQQVNNSKIAWLRCLLLIYGQHPGGRGSGGTDC